LFGASIEAGFTWLAVIAILNSVLSLAVYLRIIVPMYQQPIITAAPDSSPMPLVRWVLGIAFAFTLGIGLAAQVLLGQLA